MLKWSSCFLERMRIWIVKPQKGVTALMCASQEGHIECAKLLLEKGADWFNLSLELTSTPLFKSVWTFSSSFTFLTCHDEFLNRHRCDLLVLMILDDGRLFWELFFMFYVAVTKSARVRAAPVALAARFRLTDRVPSLTFLDILWHALARGEKLAYHLWRFCHSHQSPVTSHNVLYIRWKVSRRHTRALLSQQVLYVFITHASQRRIFVLRSKPSRSAFDVQAH